MTSSSEASPREGEGAHSGKHPVPVLAELARKARSTKQTALVSVIPQGAGHKVGYWLTPPEIMERLAELGDVLNFLVFDAALDEAVRSKKVL